MAPFVYINGYPGVGKLTVAKELCQQLQKAQVVNNHLLIDPAAAVFGRGDPEYQPLRAAVRRAVLRSIAGSTTKQDVTWIFTDSQSSDPLGSAAAKDYQDAASERGSPFVSVILHCDLDENLARAMGEGRGGSNTKLTDLSILRSIRESEDLFSVGDKYELQLDVTKLSPAEAATKIREHMEAVCPGK